MFEEKWPINRVTRSSDVDVNVVVTVLLVVVVDVVLNLYSSFVSRALKLSKLRALH